MWVVLQKYYMYHLFQIFRYVGKFIRKKESDSEMRRQAYINSTDVCINNHHSISATSTGISFTFILSTVPLRIVIIRSAIGVID